MGLFGIGLRDIVIIPEEKYKPSYYRFMEMGDLVYYTPPGSTAKVTATVEYFTRDDNGTPQEVTITTSAGEQITTTIKHITY